MKDKHIIETLEQVPFISLSKSELAEFQVHANDCQNCRSALETAYIASALVQERAAEVLAPRPFFQTRVLVALRERQKANEGWVLGRMWRAAGVLVSSMAATVAMLAVLTVAFPTSDSAANAPIASAANSYSAEEVIFNQKHQTNEKGSHSTRLNTLY